MTRRVKVTGCGLITWLHHTPTGMTNLLIMAVLTVLLFKKVENGMTKSVTKNWTIFVKSQVRYFYLPLSFSLTLIHHLEPWMIVIVNAIINVHKWFLYVNIWQVVHGSTTNLFYSFLCIGPKAEKTDGFDSKGLLKPVSRLLNNPETAPTHLFEDLAKSGFRPGMSSYCVYLLF